MSVLSLLSVAFVLSVLSIWPQWITWTPRPPRTPRLELANCTLLTSKVDVIPYWSDMGPKNVTLIIIKNWRGWHLVDIVPLVTHNVFASLHLLAHIQCASLHNTVFRNNGWRWNDSHSKAFKLWHNVFLIRYLSDPGPVIAFSCPSVRHPTSGLLEFCLNCWICQNFYMDFSNC